MLELRQAFFCLSCLPLLAHSFLFHPFASSAARAPRESSNPYSARRVPISCNALPLLNQEEVERYSRHLILQDFGIQGQRMLKAGSVLCIGAGGLGSPALMYLAAAGVGRIGIIDNDVVDLSNLQRQVIHSNSGVGIPKVDSAKQRILEINPMVEVETYSEEITSDNALRILGKYDVVLDGSDNFPTRYLVNDACVILGKPYVYGAILRFEGQASVFNYQGGPNYRDFLPQPPAPDEVPSCAEGGVLGVLPGVIGGIQATEAIKILTGTGTPLSGRILVYNAMHMVFREIPLLKNPQAPSVKELIDYKGFCRAQAKTNTKEAGAPKEVRKNEGRGENGFDRLTAKEARALFERGWTPYVLDVRTAEEAEIAQLPFTDRLCPHGEVSKIAHELPRDSDIFVFCKGGIRSKKACETLASLGFSRLVDLEGGILSWAREVDASIPKY